VAALKISFLIRAKFRVNIVIPPLPINFQHASGFAFKYETARLQHFDRGGIITLYSRFDSVKAQPIKTEGGGGADGCSGKATARKLFTYPIPQFR
jgi:hypothetical protein